VDLFCVCVFCGSVIVCICVCAFGRYSLVFVFLLSFGVCDDLWICFVFVFFVDLSRFIARYSMDFWCFCCVLVFVMFCGFVMCLCLLGIFVVFWCL